jgi:hypothetical protein
MTSTSTVAIDEARARVCAVQDEVLSKLGIVALAGLGSRSTR